MSTFIPPDWRDASAYPAKVDQWLLGPWVWAFLRRNPEYQKDYEHFASLPSYYADGIETSKWCARSTHDDDDAKLRYCKYPILPDEKVHEYVARTGDETPYDYSLEAHLMEKWETIGVADPANEGGHHCIVFEVILPKVIEEQYIFCHEKEELTQKDPEPEEIFETTLRFDLRYSIDTQIKHAEDHLKRLKDDLEQGVLPIEKIRKKGINRTYFPQYLRAYDAYQAGATDLEIAKYLYPERKIVLSSSKYNSRHTTDSDKQKAHRAVTNGKRLVIGGYKKLLKLP